MALKRLRSGGFQIKNKAEAIEALERHLQIEDEIREKIVESTELKKAATAYAKEKKLDTLQLPGVYFRLITRYNKLWVGTPDDMPVNAPKGAKALSQIVKGKKVNGKALWQLVTKRVPDPELINEAVGKGWIKESEISKAFIEKPQAPFLQKFEGEA